MGKIKIKLGATYSDIITGVTGVATAKVKYITGCDKVELQPRTKEYGTVPESVWVDVTRLVLVDVPVIEVKVSEKASENGAGNVPHGRAL